MCSRPFVRSYISKIDGLRHSVSCPCGHCASCVSDFQDVWSFRALEASRSCKCVVFETFTYKDSSLHRIDILTDSGFVPDSPIDRAFLNKWGSYVPIYYKPDIQNFIKSARQSYFRDFNKRLDVKYLVASELCPSSLRPHYHALFFFPDDGFDIYEKYFKSRWNTEYGFTYSRQLCPLTADLSRVVNYVSKYLLKGDFESDLVKSGILPKPFRLVSKGFGSGYADSDSFKLAKSVVNRILERYPELGISEPSAKDLLHFYRRISCFPNLTKYKFNLSDDEINALTRCYDINGFSRPLPRYYKDILFRNLPILRIALQNFLSGESLHDYFKELQAFASSKGFQLSDDSEHLPDFGLLPDVAASLYMSFVASKEYQKSLKEQRSSIRLSNHYKRSSLLNL